MLVFGFGISTDVDNLSFAVLDRDQSPRAAPISRNSAVRRYFVEKPRSPIMPISNGGLQSGDINAAIEIPPGFGRDIKRGRPVWVGAWVDGAMPFRAETIRGYLQGMHQLYLADPAVKTTQGTAAARHDIETRFSYNQDFDSIYAMVPSTHRAAAGVDSRRS